MIKEDGDQMPGIFYLREGVIVRAFLYKTIAVRAGLLEADCLRVSGGVPPRYSHGDDAKVPSSMRSACMDLDIDAGVFLSQHSTANRDFPKMHNYLN